MHGQAQFPSSVFRAISLAIIAASVVAVTIVPAWAQNSVPPTAVQAAKMPQFASHLAPPAKRPAPLNSVVRAKSRPGPRDSSDIYDNGPINGNTDAWTINFGFIVGDTFYLANNGTEVTGMSFGAWLSPGDTLTSAELSITSSPFSGTSYFDQTVSFTQGSCTVNEYGYNVCTETASFSGPTLNSGMYWVNLQNASIPSGDPAYWDENSGVGCTGTGCPSQADENEVGTIPSESFTILGNGTTQAPPECVHDVDNFNIIYNFTESQGSPSPGLAIDRAGNLYGTASETYELAENHGSWIFTPLYNIGGPPPIIGPEGALYGVANAGLQNCGSSGNQACGLVYRLQPPPTACLTSLCSWDQTVIYEFQGNPDGWQPTGNLVFDNAGNLYGITTYGGIYGLGAVYELTPSNSGWTETVIYSFQGWPPDGSQPNSLVIGQDGKLSGTTTYGSSGSVIFQLIQTDGQWQENILETFPPCEFLCDQSPQLFQQRFGTLYGLDTYVEQDCYDSYDSGWCFDVTYGRIFALTPSGNNWNFNVIADTEGWCGGPGDCFAVFEGITLDTAGTLYGTFDAYLDYYYNGEQFWTSAVFKSPPGYHEPLIGFNGLDFRDVEVDANGNLYGTTGQCGESQGTVWQISP